MLRPQHAQAHRYAGSHSARAPRTLSKLRIQGLVCSRIWAAWAGSEPGRAGQEGGGRSGTCALLAYLQLFMLHQAQE